MSKKPVHEVRLGKIRAAIWRNGEKGKSWFSVSLSKIYTDADGKWKDTTSFHRDDLPLLCKVADLAHRGASTTGRKKQRTPRRPNG